MKPIKDYALSTLVAGVLLSTGALLHARLERREQPSPVAAGAPARRDAAASIQALGSASHPECAPLSEGWIAQMPTIPAGCHAATNRDRGWAKIWCGEHRDGAYVQISALGVRVVDCTANAP
jgi:hypothetical protein